MKVLLTYRLVDLTSGLIDETAELKLVAQTTEQIDVVSQTIDEGVTDKAPSEDAVFQALADKQDNLGFTPENVANKENTTLDNSTTKYPTNNLVFNERAPIVVSTSQTATLNRVHNVVANATLTDPTPVEGMGYPVNVINGVATVGGTAYSVGTQLYRYYHSGSWRTAVYLSNNLPSIGVLVNDITPSGNVTGTTGETFVKTIAFPAGTFENGDVFKIDMLSVRNATAVSTSLLRIRHSTSATPSTSHTQIAIANSTSTFWVNPLVRTCVFRSPTTFEIMSLNTASNNDLNATGNTGLSTITFDNSVMNYFHIFIQNFNNADSFYVPRVTIEKLKQKSTI